ncbi:16S rRNA (cytidine(1402)-2'-O)-methyltransferase [Vagococcus xieshaowenii]|uniref:Ribosomal RNA small subunit methyltransferase I n=1 Tax=Vagococcus xieshaowenii TaxID=2562451 RepID=A0AAJ5JMA2_9ENTE|nr:16S rRNA (cytidine(1402)-2'-O)-methyltransferase [Vagococcus xieshaowenii]QCA29089.1 16S rRNA (cytidine(1402)-2'-O)-methyltransferase [Vagococcus xieshaowenii]TFZ40935.1 16S rRNA (cytidine(1402)-2'-O)-methyltransferase [Vagococcus xieshaowenii]
MNRQKSYKELDSQGCLYLVPTPIGNLEDISYRALNILKTVDFVASEDTRNTQKLLNHFDIKVNQISFHEHNSQQRIPELIDYLQAGQSIAQVSDAGMPSISDPGHDLVKACIEENIRVISLPGATAGVTALIASGLPSDTFTFVGFLPRKKGEQKAIFQKLIGREETQIIYESPYRVKTTLENMLEIYPETHPVVLCRELTKIHEEYLRGSIRELLEYLGEHEIKGECCLMIGGGQEQLSTLHEEQLSLTIKEHVETLMSDNQLSSKAAIKEVAKLRGMKKQDIYKEYHDL